MQTTSNSVKLLRRGFGGHVLLGGVLVGGAGVRWLLGTASVPVTAAVNGVPVSPADALLGGVALSAAIGVAWLVIGVALELLARAPGALGRASARVSAAVTPRLVRRAVGIALGMGMGVGLGASPSPAVSTRVAPAAVHESLVRATATAGTGTTAAADRLPDPDRAVAPDRVLAPDPDRALAPDPDRALAPDPDLTLAPDPGWAPAPDPGWTPAAPVVRPQPDVSAVSAAGRRSAVTDHDEVVVRRGDSLWTISARHLGPGATDAEVAAEWPRWYAANRDVIGPDPDLLLPGQVLRPPEEPR